MTPTLVSPTRNRRSKTETYVASLNFVNFFKLFAPDGSRAGRAELAELTEPAEVPEPTELAELSGPRELKRGKTHEKINIFWSRSLLRPVGSFKTYLSVADVPQKVAKTSSEITNFANSVHAYRTSGSSAGAVDFWRSSPMSNF